MKYGKVVLLGVFFAFLSFLVLIIVSFPMKSTELPHEDGTVLIPQTFKKDISTLNGEWRFRYGDFYTEKEMESAILVDVPDSWSAYGYNKYGVGTYLLRLETEESVNLSIYFSQIPAAYKCYLNGEPLSSNGTISSDPTAEHIQLNTRIIPFPFQQGINELLIHVSNHVWMDSGLFYSLYIGETEALYHQILLKRIVAAFVLGTFFIIGLYHLILFSFRHKEREYLFLGILCILASIRFLCDGNGIFQFFSSYPFGIFTIKMNYILLCIHTALLSLFTKSILSIRYSKIEWFASTLCILIPAFVSVFSSPGDSFIFMPLLFFPLLYLILKGLVKKTIQKNPYYLLYMISLLF